MTFSTKHPRTKELSFQRLLNQKVAKLDLRPADTLRASLIQLRREMKRKHISFFPKFYFGEEPWGCIDGTGSVEIPFYLSNTPLRRVAENYYMSYTKQEMMMVLRHETGHALNYVYRLWKREDWRRLFGNFKRRYPNMYDYDRHSTAYVRYLHYIGNPHYAQKHPDEDFAETFAVWLDPASKWQWNYRKWKKASEKLQYIDRLFRKERIAIRRPLKARYDDSQNYKHIPLSVAEYFEIERKVDPRLREYMQDLREIFPDIGPRTRNTMRADRFIQNYWEYLEEELVTWIDKAKRRTVGKYLGDIQTLCALNDLKLRPDQATEKLVELVIVSTYHLMKTLHHLR